MSLDFLGDAENLEQIENQYWHIFSGLTTDARWRMMAAHLGEESKNIEVMASKLESSRLHRDLLLGKSVEPYVKRLQDATCLIASGGLAIIANNGDEKAWEYFGAVSRCPWCEVVPDN